jgi:hypothetical protein
VPGIAVLLGGAVLAARRFTPAVMAARYADLYEQVIAGSGSVVPNGVRDTWSLRQDNRFG